MGMAFLDAVQFPLAHAKKRSLGLVSWST